MRLVLKKNYIPFLLMSLNSSSIRKYLGIPIETLTSGKKIAEEQRRNPNSERIKKWQQQLQYALEEEGKKDKAKAEEAAKRRAQGFSAYGGSKTKSGFDEAWERWEKAKKSWDDFNRAEDAANKTAQEDFEKVRQRVNQESRKAYNTKINKGMKNIRKGGLIVGGTIVAGVGINAAVKAKKNQKKWEEKKAKMYSSKIEETPEQKRERRIDSGIILGTTSGSGAILGNRYVTSAGKFVKNKAKNQNFKEWFQKEMDPNTDLFRASGAFDKDIKHSEEAVKSLERRVDKIVKKKKGKAALIGATAGLALGAPLAYASNTHSKMSNEQRNAAKLKRTKKK